MRVLRQSILDIKIELKKKKRQLSHRKAWREHNNYALCASVFLNDFLGY